MRRQIAFTAIVVTVIVVAMCTAVYAQTVNVQIGSPSNSNGDLGVTEGSYWIGEFPVTINPGSAQSTTGEVFCMNADGTVYEGSTYTATEAQVPNNSTWQAISYILSWDSPTTDTQAAVDQVAIWMILGQNPPYSDFAIDPSILSAASALKASANGLNVAEQGDQLTWILPSRGASDGSISMVANPGQTMVFEVQLTDSQGNPQSNVQIDFSGTITPPQSSQSTPLSSAYFSSQTTFTDSNGMAKVTITVPSDAAYGSTIAVQASTQSVYPVEFLDLISNTPGTQDLLGVGQALDLTASYNVAVLGYVTVLPESALGALSAIAAFAAAFLIFQKYRHR